MKEDDFNEIKLLFDKFLDVIQLISYLCIILVFICFLIIYNIKTITNSFDIIQSITYETLLDFTTYIYYIFIIAVIVEIIRFYQVKTIIFNIKDFLIKNIINRFFIIVYIFVVSFGSAIVLWFILCCIYDNSFIFSILSTWIKALWYNLFIDLIPDMSNYLVSILFCNIFLLIFSLKTLIKKRKLLLQLIIFIIILLFPIPLKKYSIISNTPIIEYVTTKIKKPLPFPEKNIIQISSKEENICMNHNIKTKDTYTLQIIPNYFWVYKKTDITTDVGNISIEEQLLNRQNFFEVVTDIIAIGVASQEGSKYQEKHRALKRAEKLAKLIKESIQTTRAPKLHILNLGQHKNISTQINQETNNQRKIIIVGIDRKNDNDLTNNVKTFFNKCWNNKELKYAIMPDNYSEYSKFDLSSYD